jgi:hypothetical protein
MFIENTDFAERLFYFKKLVMAIEVTLILGFIAI